jgi:hypothetical protein
MPKTILSKLVKEIHELENCPEGHFSSFVEKAKEFGGCIKKKRKSKKGKTFTCQVELPTGEFVFYILDLRKILGDDYF